MPPHNKATCYVMPAVNALVELTEHALAQRWQTFDEHFAVAPGALEPNGDTQPIGLCDGCTSGGVHSRPHP